jgi:hypothetical protein
MLKRFFYRRWLGKQIAKRLKMIWGIEAVQPTR